MDNLYLTIRMNMHLQQLCDYFPDAELFLYNPTLSVLLPEENNMLKVT